MVRAADHQILEVVEREATVNQPALKLTLPCENDGSVILEQHREGSTGDLIWQFCRWRWRAQYPQFILPNLYKYVIGQAGYVREATIERVLRDLANPQSGKEPVIAYDCPRQGREGYTLTMVRDKSGVMLP